MPSYSYYGCTALEAAKSRPASSEIVDILIAKGARDTALLLDPHRKIELCEAAYKGDLDRIQYLVNLGVQIDMQMIKCQFHKDTSPQTVLDWALCNYDDAVNVELFRFLLGKVQDVNAQDKASYLTPLLCRAIQRRSIELVEILIDAGADVNGYRCNAVGSYTPLMNAVYHHNGEIMRLLLRKGADINAIIESSPSVTTALQVSLQHMNIDIFYILLANGAKINASIARRGYSELAYAAKTGSRRVIETLLDQGAEIDSGSFDGGQTALQAAAGLDPANMAMVRLLLERGADVNALGRLTALQAAVQRGHFQLVLFFLENGADINAQAHGGRYIVPYYKTALEIAAWFGRLDILHLLLKAGADMHLPIETKYVRAASLARKSGHIVIAEILEAWNKNGSAQDEQEDWAPNLKRQK